MPKSPRCRWCLDPVAEIPGKVHMPGRIPTHCHTPGSTCRHTPLYPEDVLNSTYETTRIERGKRR